jgi:maltose O-acetyltransferase
LNITEYRITKKREIIKELIPNAGANLYIEPPFFVITVTTSIGDNVFFNVNCVVLDCTKVTIGSNVFLPGVQLYTATHPLDAETRKHLKVPYP